MLTYEASPTGSFLINSYDFPALGFQDTKFVWAFLSFDNPISPFVLPGDFNDDGIVDAGDYQVWRAQFGQAGQSLSADGNRDGVVDAADYVVWRKGLSACRVRQRQHDTGADRYCNCRHCAHTILDRAICNFDWPLPSGEAASYRAVREHAYQWQRGSLTRSIPRDLSRRERIGAY